MTSTATSAPPVPPTESNAAATSQLLEKTSSSPSASVSVPNPPPFATVPFSGVAASLYVGELHPEVNEAILFEHFSQIGPVASIRVCRDALTRRSLGYAYVNFHNALDAERAIDSLNYMPIRGRPCRIMWSQRDPSLRKSGSGNIFIKNLDKTVDNKALHDTFNSFGNVLSCKVVCDSQGVSKGFAFVHFETQEAADQAIARVNGKMLNGKIVYVGPYQSRKERLPRIEEAKNNFTNVFIKNLDTSMTDEQFIELVQPFGSITSASLQKDAQGVSRGFGFVNYSTHEAAEAAIASLNGKSMGEGKNDLFASRAQLKSERLEELRKAYEKMREEKLAKYTNLYVKNLDDQVDEQALKNEFLPYGPIYSTVIMRDEKGGSKGFGFVSYESSADAAKAIAELNGKIIHGKPLYVAMAQRKEERRMQLEALYAQRMMKQYAAPAIFYPGTAIPPASAAGMNVRAVGPSAAAAYAAAAYHPGAALYPGHHHHHPSALHHAQSAGGAGPSGASLPPRPPQRIVTGAGGQILAGVPPSGNRGPRRGPEDHRPNPSRSLPTSHQYNSGNAAAGGYRRANPSSSVSGGGAGSRAANTGALNATLLAAASPEEQKQMLGERLFPLVRAREPELAGKITGMLIEMDNGEILHLLESPDSLAAKVDEALEVIRFHSSNASNKA